ncbi:MAG TPA: hypothetical protein VIQ28_06400 [Burkholderiales bacterium]
MGAAKAVKEKAEAAINTASSFIYASPKVVAPNGAQECIESSMRARKKRVIQAGLIVKQD